jgi:ribosomal protein S18 acetylase RimI-like enzyme
MTLERPIAKHEIEDVSGMLARAFAHNPPYRAMMPWLSDEERFRAIVRVKRGFVRAAVRHHATDSIEDSGRVVAASLVCDPGQYPVSLGAKVWQATGPATLGARAIRNFLTVDAFLSARHIEGPHFYLFVLGVDPSQQGRGYGKELLRRLNARADAAHLPCWLETDKESSVLIYERAGYEVVREETIPRLSNVRFWFMRRAPR